MKKIFAILCILSLLLCGCVVEDEGLSRPPRLDVFYGEQSLQLSSGNYSWDYNNESVIADGVHPLQQEEWETLEVSADGVIRLCFFDAPESISVRYWSMEDAGKLEAEAEELAVNPAESAESYKATYELAPREETICQVSASWKNGGASYTFATK